MRTVACDSPVQLRRDVVGGGARQVVRVVLPLSAGPRSWYVVVRPVGAVTRYNITQ